MSVALSRFAALRIGPLTVRPPILLAPMAGYTDAAFRSLCRDFGCGACLTEVANAAGVARGMKRSLHLLETFPAERPVGAHLYGADPGTLAQAARRAAALGRFDFIDLNCGCPVRRVMVKGAGAELMRDPEKIGRIVRAMADAVSLPVTVKTRIGLDVSLQNLSEVAHAVESNGGCAVFVHARHAAQRHQGAADWDRLRCVKEECGIPVIGNGGVDVPADVLRMFLQTGVDGVMVGRAAVGNPWFFARAAALLAGREDPGPPSPSEVRAIAALHLQRLVGLKTIERSTRRRAVRSAEESAVLHFRSQLLRYVAGRPGVGGVRRRLQGLRSADAALGAVDAALEGSV